MHRYFAYGLGIDSDICFPELLEVRRGADIKIELANLEASVKFFPQDKEFFQANDLELYYSYDKIGTFLVYQGCKILVYPAPGRDPQLLRQYLLGNIFGALLHQRGLLVLHGSAIKVDGKAVAFVGQSGSGKSTTAASLCTKGYTFVADDLIAIDANGNRPVVYPAFPQIKLWPDVAELLGYDLSTMPYVIHTENKRSADLTSDFSPDTVPLGRIYILKMHEAIKIERLGHQESMIEMVRNSYAVKSLNAGANLRSHFSQCSKVAEYITICRLERPFDLKNLDGLTHAIEYDLRSHIKPKKVERAFR